MTRDTASAVLTAAFLLLLGAWDWWAYRAGWPTVSAAFGDALSLPVWGWVFGVAVGAVFGHLLGMTDVDATGYWWRCAAVPLAAGVVGFLLTRWS